MKKILVPVDFSKHTHVSSRFALQIARVCGSEIVLFHSFFDQFYYSDGGITTGFESGIMMTDEIILDFYKQKENLLGKLKEELISQLDEKENSQVQVSCIMESGNPEVQIIRAIELIRPDLIVMGSGGMGRKGLLAGSVARRIIDHTTLPVIAVPEISETPEIKNVAFMTTFNAEDPIAINQLDSMMQDFRLNVFCLHLSKNEKDSEAAFKMKALSENKLLKPLEGRISFFIVKQDHGSEILQEFMAAHHISLISFIPHQRNIFENLFYQGITREELFRVHLPMIALRPVQQ